MPSVVQPHGGPIPRVVQPQGGPNPRVAPSPERSHPCYGGDLEHSHPQLTLSPTSSPPHRHPTATSSTGVDTAPRHGGRSWTKLLGGHPEMSSPSPSGDRWAPSQAGGHPPPAASQKRFPPGPLHSTTAGTDGASGHQLL